MAHSSPEYQREWRELNRKHILEYRREWGARNPEKIKEYERKKRGI